MPLINYINPYMRLLDEDPNLEGVGIFLSTLAVTAISYVSLSRISRIEGRYADALHYLAQAGYLYECARPTPLGINDMWPLGSEWRRTEYIGMTFMEECMTGIRIPLEEFTGTFDLIRQSASTVYGWSEIVADCRTLARHTDCWRFHELEKEVQVSWDEEDSPEEIPAEHIFRARIEEEDGNQIRWSEFWHGAKAWASAQLSPSEYREMRRRDEQEASETRMEKYFFGKARSRLPERAQERIIDADILWTSSQRVNREALLNELQRATEEMCFAFIWHPLTEEKTASERLLTEIESRMATDKRQHPGVGDFIRIAERRVFHEFLERRKLNESEIQFLSEDLPVAMMQLRPARNSAEHDMGRTIPEHEIEELYRKFLGIGRSGILPDLVRIGGKLRVSRRSR